VLQVDTSTIIYRHDHFQFFPNKITASSANILVSIASHEWQCFEAPASSLTDHLFRALVHIDAHLSEDAFPTILDTDLYHLLITVDSFCRASNS
jgi:hypothetical protein